jgi:NADPH:quinone reductase-like Zn-dependent oxidoreductase
MKAAIIREFGALTVDEMPEPTMGEYDALCELLYGATCTGTDSHIIDGTFPWISPLPTVLGHESVGRVIAIGAKVRHYRLGDIVTRVGTPPTADLSVTWGGFAEYGIAKDHWAMCADGLSADQWQGARWNQVVPTGVDPKDAPMFTTWRETLSYITRMGFTAGASVLVIGSGGNGLAYARHAATLGASLVAMAGAAYMESAACVKAGVGLFLDYKRADLAEALNTANPDGFDFIIDAVGKVGNGDRVLACLKPGGTYGTYGIDDFGQISLDRSRARGAFTEFPCSYDEAETHQRVSEMVMQGQLDASLWYDADQAYPLEAIVDAFAAVQARKSPKALVRLRG